MKNLHLIPTEKPSRLAKHSSGTFHIVENKPHKKGLYKMTNQHIYIPVDEEIKEGDYYLTSSNTIAKADIGGAKVANSQKRPKIILTTDQDLIKDGVQAIDDEFLEWFVNNPSCEKVEVAYDKDAFPYGIETSKEHGWYKIIIPQEELIDCEYCGGDGIYITADSQKVECPACQEAPKCLTKLEIAKNIAAISIGKEEPKQTSIIDALKDISKLLDKMNARHQARETVEEAAQRLYPGIDRQVDRMLFINGAKWQAERMYSEEEVQNILKSHKKFIIKELRGLSPYKNREKWFEQFSKLKNG